MPQFLTMLAPAAGGAAATGGGMSSIAALQAAVGGGAGLGIPAAAGGAAMAPLAAGGGYGPAAGILTKLGGGLGAINQGYESLQNTEGMKFLGNVGQIGSLLNQPAPPAGPAMVSDPGPLQLPERQQNTGETALLQLLMQMLQNQGGQR